MDYSPLIVWFFFKFVIFNGWFFCHAFFLTIDFLLPLFCCLGFTVLSPSVPLFSFLFL